MNPDMRKIRSAAGRQLDYLNAFSTLTRFLPRAMKTLAAFGLVTLLTTSISYSQTTAPKQPAAEKTEGYVLGEVLGHITGQMVSHGVRVRAASDRVATGKILDFGSVKTKAEIAARRKIIDDYVATSKAADVYLDGIERSLRTELATAKVSTAVAEKSVADYMKGVNKTAAVRKEIMNAERATISTAGEIYALLDAEWGNWSADKKGMLLFQKKAALEKLNALHNRMKGSIDKQLAAEKRLAEIRANSPAPPAHRSGPAGEIETGAKTQAKRKAPLDVPTSAAQTPLDEIEKKLEGTKWSFPEHSSSAWVRLEKDRRVYVSWARSTFGRWEVTAERTLVIRPFINQKDSRVYTMDPAMRSATSADKNGQIVTPKRLD